MTFSSRESTILLQVDQQHGLTERTSSALYSPFDLLSCVDRTTSSSQVHDDSSFDSRQTILMGVLLGDGKLSSCPCSFDGCCCLCMINNQQTTNRGDLFCSFRTQQSRSFGIQIPNAVLRNGFFKSARRPVDMERNVSAHTKGHRKFRT